MHPALVITLAAAAALPLGLWLRHDLNKLGYRTADEQDLPQPGPRWWVVWAGVIAAAIIGAAATLSADQLGYLPLFPLVISGPWLAAVDFDVMRIPNHALAPTAAMTVIAILAVAATGRGWPALIVPLVSALAAGALFAGVHFATGGAIGFGDVKLATLIGLASGMLGAGVPWIGLLAGSLLAVIWRGYSRVPGPLPFGPWLLAGSALAVTLSA